MMRESNRSGRRDVRGSHGVLRGVSALGCVAAAALSFAQGATPVGAESGRSTDPAGEIVALRNAMVTPPARAASLASVVRERSGSPLRLVRFERPLGGMELASLITAGVRLGSYVGDGAYHVNLSDADPTALERVDFVDWHAELEPSWKLDPQIGERTLSTAHRRDLERRGRVALSLTAFPGVDVEQLGALTTERFDASVLSAHADPRTPELSITIPKERLQDLAALESLVWIEEAPEVTFRNATTRGIVQSGSSSSTPFYDHGLRGEGQIVGVLDSKIAQTHCSFFDTEPIGPTHRKFQAYNTTAGVFLHGTHVAGIVAGDGGDDSNTRGVAYMARIAYDETPFFNESALVALFEQHRDDGAFIHTNSWGADNRTDYNVWSRAIDRFSWENEDHAVLFAVTNQETLFTPENAKNVLAVGATFDAPSLDSHCTGGVGPTIDGRRKPEVYAPGCGSLSSYGTGCSILSQSGTSMACPAVAGAMLLTRQYFVEGFYPSGIATPSDALTPTGALMRAMIINSSVDMAGVGGYPSDLEGWGRVVADNAAHFPGDARRLIVWQNRRTDAEALDTGETGEHAFFVDADAEQLRVTMVFTDPPGAAGASASNIVINDLDLEVHSPSGQVYLGNVFSGGESTTGGAPCSINTVEQVHLSAPEIGEWTIRVVGSDVVVGPQSYALVATGEVSESAPASCPWDLDGNGFVGPPDLSQVLSGWGAPFGPVDLSGVLASWGPCPE